MLPRAARLSRSAQCGGLVHTLLTLARPEEPGQLARSNLQGKADIFASRRDRVVTESRESKT